MVLVVLVMTRPSSPKTNFVCILSGSICRHLSNKIGFTRFVLHLQKLWQFRFYCLDLARRWSGVSGPTGVSGPKDPDTPVLYFSLPSVLFVVRYWTGVQRYPEDGPESPAHRSLRPKDPEYPAPSFFSALCIFVVWYWGRSFRPSGPESPVCPDDPASPESGRNLRPRPESPAHLHRNLRPAYAVTASFWGRL